MTDKSIIEWFSEVLNTPCREFAPHRAKPHHKPQFRVSVYGERAVDFIAAVRPFMRVKRLQADLFIEWLGTKTNPLNRDIIRDQLKRQGHRLNDDRRPKHMELENK